MNDFLKESYSPEVIFAIANDFDHASSHNQMNYPKFPDMINLIGNNSFENDQRNIGKLQNEICDLFMKENHQYFDQQKKIKENISIGTNNLKIQNALTEKKLFHGEFGSNAIEQLNEKEDFQSEIYQFYEEIDRCSYHKKENQNNAQYPFQLLTQKDYRQFQDTHFFSFFT